MDKLSSLKVFVAIVDKGSLTAAADHLDMSRATVSRHLSDLESWMGIRLLHRTTRRLSLTGPGEQTLSRARAMMALGEELELLGSEQDDTLRGLLRLTCSFTLADSFLMHVVNEFLRKWPETAIDILSVDHTVNLVEERIDIAIRITNDLEPNIVARRLGCCRSVICASPEYLEREGTPRNLDDLSTHNCLTYTYFGKSVWNFESDDGPGSVPVSGNLSANVSQILLNATLEGCGISQQPVPDVHSFIEKGELVALLPEWEPQAMGVYAVYGTRKQMTTLQRRFLDVLVEKMSEDPLWK